MKNELGLFEKKNQILVSSRVVAEKFSVRHDNLVNTTIKGILKDMEGSPEFQDTPLFQKQHYIHEQNNQEYLEYLLNKRAFLLVMMRLKGIVAYVLQNQYIDAFEQMEVALRERQTTDWLQTREKGKMIRRQETDAIQQLIPYAQEQGSQNALKLYMTYSKLVNSIMGIESGKRKQATGKQLMQISLLEDMITNTIIEEMGKGVYYKEVYKICKKKAELFAGLTYIDSKRTALTNTDAAN